MGQQVAAGGKTEWTLRTCADREPSPIPEYETPATGVRNKIAIQINNNRTAAGFAAASKESIRPEGQETNAQLFFGHCTEFTIRRMDLTVDRGEKLRVCSCPSGRMDSLEAAAKPASRSIVIDLDGNFIPDSGRGSFHIPEWGLGHDRHMYVVSIPFCLLAATC